VELRDGNAVVRFTLENNASEEVKLARFWKEKMLPLRLALEWENQAQEHTKWLEGVTALPPMLAPGAHYSGELISTLPLALDDHVAHLILLLDFGNFQLRLLGANAPQVFSTDKNT